MSYEPPKHGSPCWVEVPSTDIARGACILTRLPWAVTIMQWCKPVKGSIDISPAKRFYSQVFNWNFKPASDDYPEDQLAMFTYPDPKLSKLCGGIVKQEPDKIKSGFIVYLYVDSIEETLAKLQEAGGKAVGEREPEGTSGWIQHFEDTEGNSCGMYTAKKESEK